MKKIYFFPIAILGICLSTNAQDVFGIDISHHQGTINWAQVATTSKVFSYIKATESNYNPSAYFHNNAALATSQNVKVGAYHFATPLFSPSYYQPSYHHQNTVNDEVENFLTAANTTYDYIGNGFLPPALDVENQIVSFTPSNGLPYDVYVNPINGSSYHVSNGIQIALPSQPAMGAAALAQWIHDWTIEVYSQTGIQPVLYCSRWYAQQLYPYYQSGLITSKLWIADISNPPGTPNTTGFQNWPWLFQQYNWNGSVSGISGYVDLDVFYGSFSDFNLLISGTSCPQPSNDYCSTPSTITASSNCSYIQGTTCGATPPTNGLATTCSTNSPPDDDVWYQFSATSTSHTITLQPITSTFDGVIQLMSGTCPSNLSNVACANSFGVGSTETLTATGLTIGSTYSVRVFSNGNGIANTGDFNICVTTSSTCNQATVTSQPTNQSATVGGTATFSVVAGGTAPFTYQWYKNGVAISGANNSSYTTPNLSTSDNGNTYYCQITNCVGVNSINSNSVVLTVTATCTAASIGTQPISQATTVGNAVVFSISANGTAPFTYQWYKNGTLISGATNYFYVTPLLTLSDNGNTYYCYVTNCNGINNVTSSTATIIVTNNCAAVSIVTQPINQSSTVGGTATFSVVANGTAPFTYQWYKNGALISGATNSSYITPALSASDNGSTFYCNITNCNGSYSATSNAATLTVISTCTAVNITSQSSTQYTTVGGTVTFVVNVSGTVPFTYQWYKNGSLISGATNNSYTTPALTLVDDGNYYYCIITNCSGASSVTSANAYVYVSLANTCSNCPCWNWAKSPIGVANYSNTNVAIDANQNIYTVGSYTSSSMVFGGVTLTNNGSSDAYLAKYDSLGNVIWARNIGGSGDDKAYGVAVDNNGNVVITGNFGSSSITIGGTTLSTPGYFVAKFDASGNALWAKGDGGACYHSNGGNPIATDASGNVIVAGQFGSPTITFGATVLSKTGNSNLFVAKYNSNGALQWAISDVTSNAGNSNSANGVAADANNNIYITGYIGTNTTFGCCNSGSWQGIYIYKISPTGVASFPAMSTGGGVGTGIAVYGSTISVTGFFTTASVTVGTNTASNANPGSSDILFLQTDTANIAGNVSVFRSGGTSNDEAYNIYADANGNRFVTGMFQSTSLNLANSITINNIGTYSTDYDAFVAKFNSVYLGGINTCIWAKAVDGGQSRGYGVASNLQGTNVFLSGDFLNSAIFNVDTLLSAGNYDNFLTKLSFYGTAQPASISGNTSVCAGSTQTYSISPVSGATSYMWQATNGTVSGTGTSVSVIWNNTISGTIQVASQNSCGLSAYQTLNVTLNGSPEQPSSISGNSNPCQNSAQTYSIGAVSGATSYAWQATNGTVTGSGTSVSVTWNGSSTGVVQVASVNPCGQSAFKILNVTLASPPNQPSAINGNSNLCTGSSAVYSIPAVSGAISYSWLCTNGTVSGTGTSVSVTWNNTSSGSIQVASQNSCGLSAYQTLNVTLNNPPTQPGSISGIPNPCKGSTNSYSILPVANATSYNWTLPNGWLGNSNTTNINTVAGNTNGSVSVSAVNVCGSSTAQNLTVNPKPIPNITVNSPTICIGQTAVLVANGGDSYSWSSGLIANGNTASSSPSATTNYSVTGSLNGCSNTAYSTVTVNSPSPGTINNLPNAVCFNHTPINISGTPIGGTFSGFGISGTTFNPANAEIGANTITYSYNSNGCSATTSKSIKVDTLVTPNITTTGPAIFCSGDSVTIIGNFNNGIWSNNSTAPAITVSSSGTYYLTNTSTCGSTNSNQIVIKENTLPIVDAGNPITVLVGNPTIIGGNPTANGNAPFTYSWTPTAGLSSVNVANPLTSPLDTTNYIVVVTDVNGCSNVDSILVTVEIKPGFLVYPNPTNDLLSITGSIIENGEYRFELINVIGQIIFTDKLTVSNHSMQKQFSLSGLTSGIYFMKIENGKTRTIKKVYKGN